jgi:hypothetical protein
MRAPFKLTFSVQPYSAHSGFCPFEINTRNFWSSRFSRRPINSLVLTFGLVLRQKVGLEMNFLFQSGICHRVEWMLDPKPESCNQAKTRFAYWVKSFAPTYSSITRPSPILLPALSLGPKRTPRDSSITRLSTKAVKQVPMSLAQFCNAFCND